MTRLQVVLLSNNCPAAWPRQVDFFSQWSYWFPSHKKNSPTECSLATTERSCTSCAEVWKEPPPSSLSHSRPAEPSSPAAATLRPSTSSGWLRFCFFVEIVTKCLKAGRRSRNGGTSPSREPSAGSMMENILWLVSYTFDINFQIWYQYLKGRRLVWIHQHCADRRICLSAFDCHGNASAGEDTEEHGDDDKKMIMLQWELYSMIQINTELEKTVRRGALTNVMRMSSTMLPSDSPNWFSQGRAFASVWFLIFDFFDFWFSQGRAFASVHLNQLGSRNICALAVIRRSLR